MNEQNNQNQYGTYNQPQGNTSPYQQGGQYGQSQGSQSPYQQGPYGQQGTTGYQQQQYQYQQPRSPYGQGPNYNMPMQQGPKNSGKAIAGMVLGIISLLICYIPYFGIIPSIVGLILSILCRKDVTNKPQEYKGNGMAMAGLICSILALITSLIITIACQSLVCSEFDPYY